MGFLLRFTLRFVGQDVVLKPVKLAYTEGLFFDNSSPYRL